MCRMTPRNPVTTVCFILMASILTAASSTRAQTPPATDVPRLDGIVIDGRADDWGDRGFICGLITRDGRIKPASDLDCRFRLGWDDRGLLVSLNVRDEAFVEADNAGDFYTRDSAQIFVS